MSALPVPQFKYRTHVNLANVKHNSADYFGSVVCRKNPIGDSTCFTLSYSNAGIVSYGLQAASHTLMRFDKGSVADECCVVRLDYLSESLRVFVYKRNNPYEHVPTVGPSCPPVDLRSTAENITVDLDLDAAIQLHTMIEQER